MKLTTILTGKPFMTEFGIVGYSSVILLQEDRKNILFDCGQRGCALQLKAALAEEGLGPEDITQVVISHLHFDHVGNLPLFNKAQVLISRDEFYTAKNTPDEWHCQQTVCFLEKRSNFEFVTEGDHISENVKVIGLPGHTLGLIGLKVGEDTILCSDAIKNRYELWENPLLMSVDERKSRASVNRILAEAQFIYPGHDEMLELAKPINKKEIPIKIKVANGREKILTL